MDTDQSSSRYEELEVEADDLVRRVRGLIHEGGISRLSIRQESGETILEVPLTAGVAVAAAGLVLSPVLVAVGAVAALMTRVTLGIERPAPGVTQG